MKYAHEFMQKGGKWLGDLRERFQIMFIRGNGESIIWGSDEEVMPHPTMKQIEELGSYAVAGYHREKVEPLIELLSETKELLLSIRDGKDIDEEQRDKVIGRLYYCVDGEPEWVMRVRAGLPPSHKDPPYKENPR